MFHVANQILRNDQDAEDAVHDAFLAIAEHIRKFSRLERHKTRAFVVTIVENKAIDLYRRKARRHRAPGGGQRPGPVHPAPAGAVPGVLPAQVPAGLFHPGGGSSHGHLLAGGPEAGAAGQGKAADTL